jgi:hypothetical protein
MTATTSKGEKTGAEKSSAARAVTPAPAPAPTPYAQGDVWQYADNLAVQSLLRAGARMSKYEVSERGDPFEREAESVAERVVRGGGAREGEAAAPRSRGGVGAYGRVVPGETGGRPLGDAARAFYEPRLGQDFGHVRVHTDARAAASAHALGARAFTLGRDIFFGQGLYAPETTQGRRLIAHELTHVAQQAGGTPASTSPARVRPHLI